MSLITSKNMIVTDIINKKKENNELSTDEIYWVVKNYTSGRIPDYQMSALLMAICFNGMTDRETTDLTLAMLSTGEMMDLSQIDGVKIDKHSSGGVGDKVTLCLVGIMGALSVPLVKMSGRGLGHTGGTIDKLESIPGFTCDLTSDEIIRNANDIGVVIASQTKSLVPADKKMYALRDTTSTVNQVSLIASSIMSKKMASGCDGVVLDVTVGSGAFMKNLDYATELSKLMVNIGKKAGLNTVVVLTNMDEPLGKFVGNALEVYEAVQMLCNDGPEDLNEVVYALASEMLIMAGCVDNSDEAKAQIDEAIQSGKAYQKFLQFVEAQGGDRELMSNINAFRKHYSTNYEHKVAIDASGVITRIDATLIGHASLVLGGGRQNIEDDIDFAVGIELVKKVGDEVKNGEVIAIIYGNDEDSVNKAICDINEAYEISDTVASKPEMILDIIR